MRVFLQALWIRVLQWFQPRSPYPISIPLMPTPIFVSHKQLERMINHKITISKGTLQVSPAMFEYPTLRCPFVAELESIDVDRSPVVAGAVEITLNTDTKGLLMDAKVVLYEVV